MRWMYAWVMWLLQPILRRKLQRRAKVEPLYGSFTEERFGYYHQQNIPPAKAASWVWVHAVSLGETRAAAALIHQLRAQIPGMRLLLTHGTATGRAQGKSLLQAGDVQVWQPWDTPAAVGRFLKHFQPRIGLLMETEVWPNWVAGCKAAGIPLCLVNGRLSEKSLHSALRMSWLSRPAYRALAGVWAQSEDDAHRFRQLGATVCGVMGNFKYDVLPDAEQLELGKNWRLTLNRPVVMLASSREGEERMFLDLLTSEEFRPQMEEVQWLIVPRHPQRFDEVAQLCEQAGFMVARRSLWTNFAPQQPSLLIGDSLGEMPLYYGLADVALLGGSFAPLGGQNLIEAAACGCPVVTGPHTFNFAEATHIAVEMGAALQCADMIIALRRACELARDPHALALARQASLDWVGQHRGSAQRTVADIKALLKL